jgi:hypothetical protein
MTVIAQATRWIDPRRWAALVRAYALFLVVATVAEYNKVWHLVLAPWLPTPKEATDAGMLLQPVMVGLFLLPLALSQLITACWLLLVVRPRAPATVERVSVIATEVVATVWQGQRRYRSPLILVGAVAQPQLVSILGKPFLLLPRQGLALFEHQLGADAEPAFRSVIAHEMGHLESWDDLLFFPWFAYVFCGLGFCGIGLYLSLVGRFALSLVISHAGVMAALASLGFYVVRRREAYSDSFSVVSLESLEATQLRLLAEHGRPFLDMSRVDLGLAAFIFFNFSTRATSDLAAGGGFFWATTMWLDDMTHFTILFLFLLMIGGLALAREGRPPRMLDLALAGALCMTSSQAFRFFSEGVFNLLHIGMVLLTLLGSLLVAVVPFTIALRVLSRWAVAILGRPIGDPRERLVWGALGVASAFTVLEKIYDLGSALVFRPMMGSVQKNPFAFSNAPLSDQLATFLPIMLLVALLWSSQILLGIGIALWAIVRSRSIHLPPCASCGLDTSPLRRERPLLVACPRCQATLRHDLVFELRGKSEASC